MTTGTEPTLTTDGLAMIQQIAEKCVFPVDLKENGQSFGPTRRELFAAMAMQALAPQFVNGGDFMEKHVAVGAVTLADALLKELAK